MLIYLVNVERIWPDDFLLLGSAPSRAQKSTKKLMAETNDKEEGPCVLFGVFFVGVDLRPSHNLLHRGGGGQGEEFSVLAPEINL